MSNTDDKLNKILEIADLPEKIKDVTPKIPRPRESEDVDSDYKYSRENLYNLVERGQDAIDGILDLAREGEHPRAYEVAGQLIKNVGEVTEKLLQLQEKIKKLKEVPDKAPKNVTNALFVGSTTELNKILKGKPLKTNE
jgi:hypothetical protein